MSDKHQALTVGLADLCKTQVASLLTGIEILDRPYDIEKLIEDVITPAPALIFCGPAPEGVNLVEVAQALRMSYQSTPIYFLTTVRSGFDRKNFQKNGFTDAFLLPIETSLFSQVIKEMLSQITSGKVKTFKVVKLVDVTPEMELPFDTFIHLPANNKHIKFSSKGDSLDAQRAERLKKHQVSSIEVTTDQIQTFYKFTADRLKSLGKDQTMSETERKERMQTAVRDLLSGMFNDSSSSSSTAHGKSIANDCQEIVKSYVMDGGKENSWYEKILAITGAGANAYSHASNVATYAALFSMGAGVGKPEDLAMAGILHDIGLADIPQEIQMKSESEFTAQEALVYQTHVELSLKIIRDRKLIVPEIVIKCIQQHHERMDGSGYPGGVDGKRFLPSAQILAIANLFDKLTVVEEGKTRLTPQQAMQKIKADCFKNPAMPTFDPEIINKLMSLFPS